MRRVLLLLTVLMMGFALHVSEVREAGLGEGRVQEVAGEMGDHLRDERWAAGRNLHGGGHDCRHKTMRVH